VQPVGLAACFGTVASGCVLGSGPGSAVVGVAEVPGAVGLDDLAAADARHCACRDSWCPSRAEPVVLSVVAALLSCASLFAVRTLVRAAVGPPLLGVQGRATTLCAYAPAQDARQPCTGSGSAWKPMYLGWPICSTRASMSRCSCCASLNPAQGRFRRKSSVNLRRMRTVLLGCRVLPKLRLAGSRNAFRYFTREDADATVIGACREVGGYRRSVAHPNAQEGRTLYGCAPLARRSSRPFQPAVLR
jgi:hypothetical protein